MDMLAAATALALLLTSSPPGSASPREENGDQASYAVILDVGAPEGLGAAIGWRPFQLLRVHGGVATNGFALGARGGLSAILLPGGLRPTVTVAAGHFLDGDARAVFRTVLPDARASDRLLSAVGWSFVSAQVGLELGNPQGTSFFVRGGLSRTTLRFAALGGTSAGDVPLAPKIIVQSPSVQLGVLVYLPG